MNMESKNELLTRVCEMQARYDELTRVLAGLDEAISEYKNFKPDLEILRDYLNSDQLKADIGIEDISIIPGEIKRGVLSEEGLLSLLQGADKILNLAQLVLK